MTQTDTRKDTDTYKGYEIKLLPNDIYQLTDVSTSRPISLGCYTSDTLAHRERERWIARDEIQEQANEFGLEMVERYGSILDTREIKQLIEDTM